MSKFLQHYSSYLSFRHNYFSSTKLFSDLFKVSDTSAKWFFLWMYVFSTYSVRPTMFHIWKLDNHDWFVGEKKRENFLVPRRPESHDEIGRVSRTRIRTIQANLCPHVLAIMLCNRRNAEPWETGWDRGGRRCKLWPGGCGLMGKCFLCCR